MTALGYGNNFVVLLKLIAFFRRTARDQALYFAVAIVPSEFRADAAQRQAHADGEILRVLGVQVIRVRIIGMREGIQIGLHDVGVVELVEGADFAFVTVLNGLGYVGQIGSGI